MSIYFNSKIFYQIIHIFKLIIVNIIDNVNKHSYYAKLNQYLINVGT